MSEELIPFDIGSAQHPSGVPFRNVFPRSAPACDGESAWRTPSNEEWAECKAWARWSARDRRELERVTRNEWIEGVRRRLGLVTEMHRCRVWKRGEGDWASRCLRPGCRVVVGWASSQQYALGDALAHAGAFLPLPPEEVPVTELDLLAFDALWTSMRAEQDAFAAALPERANAIAERINGILPDGLRFEWVADGE